jgi:hypothetical protein
MAAVLAYCLGFQEIALFSPSSNMSRVSGKHISGKLAYGYVPGPGALGASLTLLPFKVSNQGYGIGFRPGITVWGEFFREVKEAPAPPFDAHALGQPAGAGKGDLEGLRIVTAGVEKGFGTRIGSISLAQKDKCTISARCYES